MRTTILFWLLAILVFGTLIMSGLLLRPYNPGMFFVVQAAALAAVWLFILLYRRLIRPFRLIMEGTELLKEQDFSVRLRPVANSEANQLIAIFNRMIGQLKEQRLQVREKNNFLDLLIEASPQGLVILDFGERITQVNPSGLALLGIGSLEEVRGKRFDETGVRISGTLASLKPGHDIMVRSEGVSLLKCTRSSFLDQGFAHPFILIEELTHELLKREKASYESVIRMMAHEVNNSVGAVSATLEVVSEALNEQPGGGMTDLLPAVEASLERSLHMGRFIRNFAEVVKIPEPSITDIRLNELVRTVESLSRIECTNRNIRLLTGLCKEDPMVQIDGIQFEQVLLNIVKNAYESIGNGGTIQITTQAEPPMLVVEDDGPGIGREVKDKLFTPFFTTKPTGQGIGLMFIREVLMNHHCRFDLYTTGHGITRFEIGFLKNQRAM